MRGSTTIHKTSNYLQGQSQSFELGGQNSSKIESHKRINFFFYIRKKGLIIITK